MRKPDSVEVTRLLLAWGAGDEAALEQLVPVVYRELRRMARRESGSSVAARREKALQRV